MSCGGNGNGNGRGNNCCPPPCCPPPCCPPACCPPVVIKTRNQQQQGQCCVFQLPPVNIVCEIPPPPKGNKPPKVCCVPIVVCEEDDNQKQNCGSNGQRQQACMPVNMCCPQQGNQRQC